MAALDFAYGRDSEISGLGQIFLRPVEERAAGFNLPRINRVVDRGTHGPPFQKYLFLLVYYRRCRKSRLAAAFPNEIKQMAMGFGDGRALDDNYFFSDIGGVVDFRRQRDFIVVNKLDVAFKKLFGN
jgi:hypothetical protein